MAYSMKTVAPSTKLLAPRPLSIRARTSRATFGRSRLVIEAKTVWELEAGGANKNKETVILNDKINESKALVSVGDSKHEGAERVRAAWCIFGQMPKHLRYQPRHAVYHKCMHEILRFFFHCKRSVICFANLKLTCIAWGPQERGRFARTGPRR